MSDTLKLNEGEYLLKEGEGSSQMYFLQEGTLVVHKLKEGENVQIGTVYAGEIVGEMSFLDKEPRSATVMAATSCTLIAIPREKFEGYLDSQPSWYSALVNTLLDRLRKANSKIRI